MPPRSSLSTAKPLIKSFLAEAGPRAYRERQLADVLYDNRARWSIAGRIGLSDFISFLVKERLLRTCKLISIKYEREMTRYAYGRISPLHLAASISSEAYFCHGTALALHGLAGFDRKAIYLNIEQRPKGIGDGSLTQTGIARAFAGQQRQSALVYEHQGTSITMISGKHTKNLAVELIDHRGFPAVPATDLERTLIDIVVRPGYAGGTSRVFDAYRVARRRVSVEGLLNILHKLDYIYPYHQAIGFLMQRAGYPESEWARLLNLGLDYDFYLAHGIKQPLYDPVWRLFYPADLPAK